MVQIPSFNSKPFPNEFESLKDGSYKNSPVKIDALMIYPKKGKEPFPVLVYNHAREELLLAMNGSNLID